MIELTDVEGGEILLSLQHISSVTKTRSVDPPGARAVVVMDNGNRHAVKQTLLEVKKLLKGPANAL